MGNKDKADLCVCKCGEHTQVTKTRVHGWQAALLEEQDTLIRTVPFDAVTCYQNTSVTVGLKTPEESWNALLIPLIINGADRRWWEGMDARGVHWDDPMRQLIVIFSCAHRKEHLLLILTAKTFVSQKFPLMQQAVIQLFWCPDRSRHVFKRAFPIKQKKPSNTAVPLLLTVKSWKCFADSAHK